MLQVGNEACTPVLPELDAGQEKAVNALFSTLVLLARTLEAEQHIQPRWPNERRAASESSTRDVGKDSSTSYCT